MSKHLIKIDNPQHCALSVAHAGLDNQYCEAGEVVAIDWHPSSGWGLQEAHYTDEDGNVVSIDLSIREFTMPAKAIVVSGTAKRFVIQDWTEGANPTTGEILEVGTNGEPTPSGVKVSEVVATVVDVEDADAAITPADNTIYNCGELTSLDLVLPEGYGIDFLAQINFSSGATATQLSDEGDINWLGDDIDASGMFVPATSKRYVIMLYPDGVDMRGVVSGTTPLT